MDEVKPILYKARMDMFFQDFMSFLDRATGNVDTIPVVRAHNNLGFAYRFTSNPGDYGLLITDMLGDEEFKEEHDFSYNPLHAIKAIRSKDSDITIVALTQIDHPNAESECHSIGIDHYVAEPIVSGNPSHDQSARLAHIIWSQYKDTGYGNVLAQAARRNRQYGDKLDLMLTK